MTGVAYRICLGVPGESCRVRVRGRSRCADHARLYEQLREQRRAATRDTTNPWRWIYRDGRWPKARKACLIRDGYACVDCGHYDPSGGTLQADHVRALQDGGEPFDVENLATRCTGPGTRNCHAKVERERRRARKQKRA